MIQYIYFVKCPNCEDEHFDFFDKAKEYALGCLSCKPIITQTEVCRNDFGECTDSNDLGTIWSWEDMMKDVPEDTDCSVFTKGDLNNFAEYNPDSDPEFDDTTDFLDNIPDNFRKSGTAITENMSKEDEIRDLAKEMYDLGVACDSYEEFASFMRDNNDIPTEELYSIYQDALKSCIKKPILESINKSLPPSRSAMLNAIHLLGSNNRAYRDRFKTFISDTGSSYEDDLTNEEILEFFNKVRHEIFEYERSYDFAVLDAFGLVTDSGDIKESVYKKLAPEELAESSVNKFVIVGEKEDYSRQFYNAESDEWVTKSDDATLFDDRNSAIEVWHDLDKSDFYNTRIMIKLVPITESASNNSDNFRKPVPEGMSIEDLVEAMEENEDEVECTLCNELFPKVDCHYDEDEGYICAQCKEDTVKCEWCGFRYDPSELRKEVNLGWLCSRCEMAIKSRGETLTFREGPLDETCECDPLDHHDPVYNEDIAADYIADQNDRVKDANFDIKSSSFQESFNPRESVEFEYDDLEITVTQGDMDPETGTYDTCERTVSYTYEQDKGDVAVDIWENFITEEDVADVPGGLEALEDETLWNKFLETHFDTLFEKYYKNLLEFYREYATSSCQDNYDSGYENFDDFYFEDIDKNTIGHSMLEELEESEDYRNRLTLCPECGTNSFGPETCICMNCGFNTLK